MAGLVWRITVKDLCTAVFHRKFWDRYYSVGDEILIPAFPSTFLTMRSFSRAPLPVPPCDEILDPALMAFYGEILGSCCIWCSVRGFFAPTPINSSTRPWLQSSSLLNHCGDNSLPHRRSSFNNIGGVTDCWHKLAWSCTSSARICILFESESAFPIR